MRFFVLALLVLVQATTAFISTTKRIDSSFSLNLFGKKKPAVSSSSKSSPEAVAAIEIFRKSSPKSELTDAALLEAFVQTANLFKGDKASALLCYKNQPGLFIITARSTTARDDSMPVGKYGRLTKTGYQSSITTAKECFTAYENKFGFEKAIGLVTRNPNLLAIRPTGYGSAEVAADETIYMSYLVDATRGRGQYLLGALALLLLCKPLGIHF
jgi:hypothetical protein